jgi:hypothetical protein
VEETLVETYQELWQTRRFSETLAVPMDAAPDATIPIAPPSRSPSTRGLPSLPVLRIDDQDSLESPPDLIFGKTLGQGGMGLVRRAEQVALRREVAVKTLKPGLHDERAAWEMLREAWLTGRLEHPNIAPIYGLGRDSDENPVLIMKRIEGKTWRHFLNEPADLPESAQRDPLVWHIGIALEICQALAFAHCRGILHRDIKPDNVMIGDYGEVYLLDWGIAVSMDEADRGRFPLASEVDSVAGTPRYMSPEMAAADSTKIGPRSDVYLVAATLYEVIAGRPLHNGHRLMEVLTSAFSGREPVLPEETSPELAAILRRALAREPADRFDSIHSLKEALELFLSHRGSQALASNALAMVPDFEALAKADDGGPEAEAAVTRQYGELRFAFQQALEAWPENNCARSGLARSCQAFIEHALHKGDAGAARRAIEDWPEADEALIAKVQEASERRQQELAELAELRAQNDFSTGSGARTIYAIAFAIVYAIIPPFMDQCMKAGFQVPKWLFVVETAALLVSLLPSIIFWNTAASSQVNRRVVQGLVATWLILMVHRWQGVLFGSVMHEIIAEEMLILGFLLLLMGVLVDRLVAAGAIVYILGALLAPLMPDKVFIFYGIANGLACLWCAWVWHPESEECVLEIPGANLPNLKNALRLVSGGVKAESKL